MARGGGRSSLFQPGRTAEQLYRHRVTRVHAFYLYGNIDQAVGFDHGGQNPGSLITGGPNFEHAALTPQDPTEKMPAVGSFRKFFLKHRLQHWAPIPVRPGKFEHRRSNQLLECHHG